MLPPERGRAMLGARPPCRRAGAVVAVGARAGDAVEATVRRAARPGRVGPQAREPRLHARQAVSRIVATSKEADLRHTEKLREGDRMRARVPRGQIVGQEEGPPAVEIFRDDPLVITLANAWRDPRSLKMRPLLVLQSCVIATSCRVAEDPLLDNYKNAT